MWTLVIILARHNLHNFEGSFGERGLISAGPQGPHLAGVTKPLHLALGLALFTCYAISLADADHRRELFRLPHCLRPPGTVHFVLGITHPGLASTFHSMLATYTKSGLCPQWDAYMRQSLVTGVAISMGT